MDHKGFDDNFREKFSQLEPSFDAGAWEDMEDILRYSLKKPWYVRYRKALWSSALATITLLNLLVFWQNFEHKESLNQMMANHQHQMVVDTIRYVDTVFFQSNPNFNYSKLGQYNNPAYPNSSLAGNEPMQRVSPASQYYGVHGNKEVNKTNLQYAGFLLANTSNGIPSLFSKNLLNISNIPWGQSESDHRELVDPIPGYNDDPMRWINAFVDSYQIEKDNTTVISKPKGKRTRHWQETRVGLFGGVLIPDPDIGEKYISNKLSFSIEQSINRNLRFLSGVHYHNFTYKLNEVDDNNFEMDDLVKFPGFALLASSPDDIIIENKMLQIPLHLRLYKPLNHNWSVFLSGGPSLDILLNQSFTYNYIDIENDRLIERNDLTKIDNLTVYLGSLSGSLGIEHRFSRQLAAQMNLDFQYGLSNIGVERRSVNSLSLNVGVFYKLK